jgi:hypothetical protein
MPFVLPTPVRNLRVLSAANPDHIPLIMFGLPASYAGGAGAGAGCGAPLAEEAEEAASNEVVPLEYDAGIDASLAVRANYPPKGVDMNKGCPTGNPEWTADMFEAAIKIGKSPNYLTYTCSHKSVIDASLSTMEGTPAGSFNLFYSKNWTAYYFHYKSEVGDLWEICYRKGYFNSARKVK